MLGRAAFVFRGYLLKLNTGRFISNFTYSIYLICCGSRLGVFGVQHLWVVFIFFLRLRALSPLPRSTVLNSSIILFDRIKFNLFVWTLLLKNENFIEIFQISPRKWTKIEADSPYNRILRIACDKFHLYLPVPKCWACLSSIFSTSAPVTEFINVRRWRPKSLRKCHVPRVNCQEKFMSNVAKLTYSTCIFAPRHNWWNYTSAKLQINGRNWRYWRASCFLHNLFAVNTKISFSQFAFASQLLA